MTSLSGRTQRPAAWAGGLLFSGFLSTPVTSRRDRQVLTPGDEPAHPLLGEVSVSSRADMAREYKTVGPEVPAPASAPPLDRARGAAGRDPAWAA